MGGTDAEMARAQILSTFAPSCCSGSPSVCAEFSSQICADSSQWTPLANVDEGTSCLMAQSLLGAFEASAETCSEKVEVPGMDSAVARAQLLAAFVEGPCCNS